MNYATSKDYEALWNLVQEGTRVPCLYHDRGIQRAGIAQKVCGEPAPPDGAFCYSKELFLTYCERMHVEVLLPDEWIRIESDKDLPPESETKLFITSAPGFEECMGSLDSERDLWVGEFVVKRKFLTHWKPLPEPPREG